MKNSHQQHLNFLFAFLGILVMIDFLLLIFFKEYRNVYGATNYITGNLWRIIPDFLMMIFYGITYFKHKNRKYSPRLLLWHGMFFGLVGVALCVPWGGYFLAPFTPIGMLFLLSIGWLPFGYFLSLFIALLFIFFNLFLISKGLSSRKVESS